ncbi:MAG TPA: oligosaccharide flippase family protein [Bryobacteraceae bacterium]
MLGNVRAPLLMSGTNAIQSLIGLGGAAIVARSLGPAGRGGINTILLWSQLATWLATLGMGRSQVYFLGAWRNEAGKRDALFPNLLAQALLSGLGMAALAFALARFLAPSLGNGVWLLLLIPLQLLSDLIGNYLLGTRFYQTYNAKKIMESALYAGALAAAAYAHHLTIGLALGAAAGAAALSTLYSVLRLRSALELHWGSARWSAFAESFRFGWQAHAADLPRMALNFAPQLVVTPWLGLRAFGLYSAALSLAGLVSLGSSALAATCFAECSGLNGERKTRAIQRNLLLAVCGCSAAGAVLALTAPFAIRTLYGPAFDESIPLARMLTLWAVVSGIGSVLQHALYSCGAPLKAASGSVSGLLVTCAALFVLLRPFGMFGVASASILGSLFELLILSSAAHRSIRKQQVHQAAFA